MMSVRNFKELKRYKSKPVIMIIGWILLTFLMIEHTPVFAQTEHINKIQSDSLELLLKHAVGDKKLKIQVELIKFYSSQNPVQAIGLGTGAKEFIADGTDPSVARDILYYTGIALHKQSNYDSLLTYAKELQEWAKKNGDKKGANLGLLLEGEYYYFKGQNEKAKEAFDQALAGFKMSKDTLNIAKTMNSIGILHVEQSDYQDALSAYTHAFYIYDEKDHTAGMAAGLGNIGYVHTHLGNYEEALSFYNRSLSLLKNIDDSWLMATTLNRMGLNYLNGRKFQQCLEVFNRALKICEENGDRAYLSYVLNNLGKTNLYLGNYEKAIAYYVRSLSIMEELNYKLGIAWINHSLAKIYDVMGDDSTALELLNKSLVIRKEIDHKYGIGVTLSHIGSIYAKLDDLELASNFYSEAYLIFSKINNQIGLMEVLSKQGIVQLNLNNYSKADSLFSIVLASEENIEDQLLIAKTLHQLAILKRRQNRYEMAIRCIDQALNKSRILGVGLETRDFLREKTLILESMGRYKEALNTHRTYKLVNDSLFTAASQRDINFIKATHKFDQEKEELLQKQEKQQLKSKEQQQQIQILEQDREIQQLWLFGMLAGLILLVAIVLLVYFLLSNRVKAKSMFLEQEQRLEQMKSDLFLNIAHELRTPMTLIMGPLSDLETNPHLSDREKRCFKLIRNNSERLVAMADEILQASKLGVEKMVVSLETIPLKRTLHQVWSSYQILADKKSISYQFEVLLDQEVWVQTEKIKLEKILGELISNALKYSRTSDKVIVTAKVYNGQLELTVSDTGPGIDQMDQTQIFKRYYQSGKAEKRKLGGVGLGLSIVKAMVEALGGTITVFSKVGEGTSFVVLLPLLLNNDTDKGEVYSNASTMDLSENFKKVEHKPTISALSNTEKDDNSKRSTVLVIDDQVDMLDYICDILYENYRVLKAMNGKQGLEILLSNVNKVDLIISDIMMPELDGLDMLTKIKENEELSHIPIIFLSAMSEDEPRVKKYSDAINGFMKKPFNSKTLFSLCEKILVEQDSIVT